MRGFSLLEVMISLAISLLLLAAVSQLGIFIEQLWLQQQATMNTMESLNVAYAWMGRDIESAGYFGCLKQRLRTTIEDPLHQLMNHEIELSENELAVQYMSPETSTVMNQLSLYQWQTKGEVSFKEGDWVVFEDCMHLSIDKIEHVSQQGDTQILSLAAPLMGEFSSQAKIGYLRQHRYQVKTTSRQNPQGEWIKSLYVLDGQWQELLEEIQAFTWLRDGDKVTVNLQLQGNEWISLQTEQKNA